MPWTRRRSAWRRSGVRRVSWPEPFDGWAARAAAVADLINPLALSEVLDWLRRRVPADAPPSLIHSDFKLDNMILAPETLAPVAVIDWDMGTRGDPLWDLAVMLSYWAEPEDPACFHRMRQMPTAQPGFWRGTKFSQPICVSAPAPSVTSPFIASCHYSARPSFFFNYTTAFGGRPGRT